MIPFRFSILVLLFFVRVASAADAFKPEAGFVSLFNGHDLTGWSYSPTEIFDGKVAATDGRFSAKDGILIAHPKEPRPKVGQKLWTTREFPKDFVLKLEFRAAPKSDSGVFIRKPQLQVRDYPTAGPEAYKSIKKYRAQDWNEIEIVVKNGVARCTCNGELLTDSLKVPPTGPLGFEADLGQMEYRRIRIREAP
ncbi:MAG: hypothetical protein RIQ93_2518 [Verrucomicrobiota bacterium]|jgi:hypothetical protein